MKTIKLIILIILSTAFNACKETPVNIAKQEDIVVLLVDKTEQVSGDNIHKSDIKRLLPVFGDSPSHGATVYLRFITDFRNNPRYAYFIEPEDPENINEITRHRDIQKFDSDIDTIISKAKGFEGGRNESLVFYSITQAINFISQRNPAGKRTLIIYSDLIENSPEFKAYNHNLVRELKSNPDLIRRQIPLFDSLDGISIYIVHTPKSKGEDLLFDIISHELRSYFENWGASVEIVTSIS